MMLIRRLSAVAIAIVTIVATLQAVAAQQPPSQSRDALLSQARRALAGGQAATALRTVEPLLARAPGDREIVEFAILAALSLDDGIRANSLYDAFVQASGADDAGLLKPMAVRELRKIVAGAANDPRLRAEVLERLARGGDAKAAADLRPGAGPRPEREALLADAALARLGDQAATKRIAEAIATPDDSGKVAAVEAVRRSGDSSQAALLAPMLRHRDPYTRMAAAESLAALGYAGALPEMRALMLDPVIEVRSKAALALVRLGDPAGREVVAAMLRSPVADVRLMAIDADPSIPAPQRSLLVRPMLLESDPLVRVKAAEMLAPDDPNAAKPVLVALTRDPDLMPRREAGRVLENLAPPDVALYRRLMTDSEPWVRMYGAGGVLKAAATARVP